MPREIDADPSATARSARWHLWALLGLTIIGGTFRFAWLDRPTFWIDEAFTYWRVSGSYKDLTRILREGGFTPLHYEAYWVLGRYTSLSPFWMRFIPAVCGTLMIPAMYFLARQVAGRNVALLTAAFTACSAYMLNYSRDAKMYMDCWLFAALHLGCLMWWLRTRWMLAWLCWIAAGLAMVGIHANSAVLVLVQPVILLSSRRLTWPTTLLFLAGLGVIAAGPAGYYWKFNQWNERIEAEGWNRASGLGWVDWTTTGREGIDLLRYPAAAFLYNWEWPREREQAAIPPRVLYWYTNAGIALGILLALGLFPWGGLRRRRAGGATGTGDDSQTDRTPLAASQDQPIQPAVVNPHSAPPAPRGAAPEPWWRSTFWVLAWVVLPPWVLYMTSESRAVSPFDWTDDLRNWLDTPAEVILAGTILLAAFSCCAPTLLGRLTKTASLLTVLGALLLLCWLIGTNVVVRHAGSLWVPRYLGIIWPALAIAVCALVMRLPGWPLRTAAIAVLLGINLANGARRIVYHTQPPLDVLARDIIAAQDEQSPTRTFLSGVEGGGIRGGFLAPTGRYYLCQAAGKRLNPFDFLVDNFNFRSDRFVRAFGLKYETGTAPSSVRRRVADAPHVEHVVVWERFGGPGPGFGIGPVVPPPGPPPAEQEDAVLRSLGAGWRRVDATDHPVYQNFSWAWFETFRRREYVRDTSR